MENASETVQDASETVQPCITPWTITQARTYHSQYIPPWTRAFYRQFLSRPIVYEEWINPPSWLVALPEQQQSIIQLMEAHDYDLDRMPREFYVCEAYLWRTGYSQGAKLRTTQAVENLVVEWINAGSPSAHLVFGRLISDQNFAMLIRIARCAPQLAATFDGFLTIEARGYPDAMWLRIAELFPHLHINVEIASEPLIMQLLERHTRVKGHTESYEKSIKILARRRLMALIMAYDGANLQLAPRHNPATWIRITNARDLSCVWQEARTIKFFRIAGALPAELQSELATIVACSMGLWPRGEPTFVQITDADIAWVRR